MQITGAAGRSWITWCQIVQSSQLQVILSSDLLRPLESRDIQMKSSNTVLPPPPSQLHQPQSCSGNNLSFRVNLCLNYVHPTSEPPGFFSYLFIHHQMSNCPVTPSRFLDTWKSIPEFEQWVNLEVHYQDDLGSLSL